MSVELRVGDRTLGDETRSIVSFEQVSAIAVSRGRDCVVPRTPRVRHSSMAATAMGVAEGLHQWADGLRGAALRGDVRVRAAREAIRMALHRRDSVSALEHALGGFGMALVGFAALQLFYVVESLAGRGAASGARRRGRPGC